MGTRNLAIRDGGEGGATLGPALLHANTLAMHNLFQAPTFLFFNSI